MCMHINIKICPLLFYNLYETLLSNHCGNVDNIFAKYTSLCFDAYKTIYINHHFICHPWICHWFVPVNWSVHTRGRSADTVSGITSHKVH